MRTYVLKKSVASSRPENLDTFELKTDMNKIPSMSLMELLITFHSTCTVRQASGGEEERGFRVLMPSANRVSGLNRCKMSLTIKYTIF